MPGLCALQRNQSSRTDGFSGEAFCLSDVQFNDPQIPVLLAAARQPCIAGGRISGRRGIADAPAIAPIKISAAFDDQLALAAMCAFDQNSARGIIAARAPAPMRRTA